MQIRHQRKKTGSLTNCKTDHERVGKMRNLERLNLRSRDLKVVLFGDDTIDCIIVVCSAVVV